MRRGRHDRVGGDERDAGGACSTRSRPTAASELDDVEVRRAHRRLRLALGWRRERSCGREPRRARLLRAARRRGARARGRCRSGTDDARRALPRRRRRCARGSRCSTSRAWRRSQRRPVERLRLPRVVPARHVRREDHARVGVHERPGRARDHLARHGLSRLAAATTAEARTALQPRRSERSSALPRRSGAFMPARARSLPRAIRSGVIAARSEKRATAEPVMSQSVAVNEPVKSRTAPSTSGARPDRVADEQHHPATAPTSAGRWATSRAASSPAGTALRRTARARRPDPSTAGQRDEPAAATRKPREPTRYPPRPKRSASNGTSSVVTSDAMLRRRGVRPRGLRSSPARRTHRAATR